MLNFTVADLYEKKYMGKLADRGTAERLDDKKNSAAKTERKPVRLCAAKAKA